MFYKTAVLILAFSSSEAFAWGSRTCNSQNIGSTTYTSCSDGTSETTQKIGGTEYTSGSNYRTGERYNTNTQNIGGSTYETRFDYGSKRRDRDNDNTGYGGYGGYGSKKRNSWDW
jgi:hypothetical protein